jgi:hypothetical protein
LWIGGAVLLGASLVTSVIRLARLTRRCTPAGDRWRELTDDLAREFRIRRRIVLLQSSHASLLVTCGLARPRIILPAGAAEWSDERKAVVLRHELAHVRRNDAALQLAAEAVRVFQWINPLVWIACRRLRQESEHACDDAVLREGIEATDYATHLLDVARHLSRRQNAWASAPAIAEHSTLERRIAAMLHQEGNRAPLTRLGWCAAALAAIGIAMPIAAAGTAANNTEGAGAITQDVAAAAVPSTANATAEPPAGVRRAPSTATRPERAAAAQTTASITGTVLDESSGSVPGAQLTLTDTAAGTQFTAVTEAQGRFAFTDLPPSRYELVVRNPGFVSVSNIFALSSGGAVQRTITLPLGTVQETITVRCGAPAASSTALPKAWLAGVWSSIFPTVWAQEPGGGARRVGGSVQPPMKTKDVKPKCPAMLPPTDTTVRLTGRIGVDGLMNDVAPVPSESGAEPPSELIDAATEAVRQWTFTATRLNGQPVPTNMKVTVLFKR